MIRIQALQKAFDQGRGKSKFVAVHGLSLEVRPGTVYALLGPNGSGKTTTFRCISTLYRPDSGNITVMGHDTIMNSAKVRTRVGFLSSEIKLSGHQSCRETLELHGRLHRLDERKLLERMEYLADLFDLRFFWAKPVAKYSTGQRQRAALAVSVVHDPDALLLDEPTNGLDILAAKAVWDFVAAEKKKGKTILLSTHSIDDAERNSDRIGLLLSGSLAAEGSSDELKVYWGNDSLENAFYALLAQDKASREEAHV